LASNTKSVLIEAVISLDNLFLTKLDCLYLTSGDFNIGVALVIDEKLFFLFTGSTTG
jgi:hypothetical protein